MFSAAGRREFACLAGKRLGKTTQGIGLYFDAHLEARLSRSWSSISRHSPSARKTKTATIAIPPAAMTAPARIPRPIDDPQSPSHCNDTSDAPIRAPANPLRQIATKAVTRAATDGRADSGPSSFTAPSVVTASPSEVGASFYDPRVPLATAPLRSILHADMDAFFVSVELRRHPELVGKPVVVGGAGPRGVVAAASYEARRYDVHSALPSVIARRRCPHAVFLSGDHEHYTEVSREVKAIFDRFTPLVEPLSLDEAFLDVTGSQALFGPAVDIAHQVRAAIRDELELDCSVGLASNKFFAKLASVDAKPRARRDSIVPGVGVFTIEPEGESAYLDQLPVGRLWGVGPVTRQKLDALGVHTAGEMARVDQRVLVAKLGPSLAAHLSSLARGQDDRPVEPDREAKSISHEETFASNLHSGAALHRELVRLADGVTRRLRAEDLGARTLSLKVRFDDGFTTITRSATSAHPTDVAQEIVAILGPILEALDPSPGVRLLGVAASNLGPAHRQLTLDDLVDDAPDWSSAGDAVEEIRDRFGTTAIGPASSLERDGLRVVRKGSQQWGPEPPS